MAASAYSSSSSSSRQRRLENGPVCALYHQTSHEFARAILSSQRMHRGTDGLAGGGIYFAETPEDTGHKAHYKGVILEARVRLGSIKVISPSGDRSITFSSLQAEQRDSVKIPRPGGVEYVVYNYDQVTHIHEYSTFGSPRDQDLPASMFTGPVSLQQWHAQGVATMQRGMLPGPSPIYGGFGAGSYCGKCGAKWEGPHHPGCVNGMINAAMLQSSLGGGLPGGAGCIHQ